MNVRRLAVLIFAFGCSAAAAAETLYAASVRIPINEGSSNVAGNLYLVDPATAAYKLIAPIRVAGTMPIGVTGLAIHPRTGVLYGITALVSPNYPRSLVTIDPASGEAVAIGNLGAAGSDIGFNAAGTLFVWLRETQQLGTVDLRTGIATPRGAVGSPGTTGGLGVDPRGQVYVAATGATGTLDRVDIATGSITRGPALTGAPHPSGINSAAVSAAGDVFAVNTNTGVPASTILVRFDPATGVVTKVGALPNDTDALAFALAGGGEAGVFSPTAKAILSGLLILIGIAAVVFVVSRRNRLDLFSGHIEVTLAPSPGAGGHARCGRGRHDLRQREGEDRSAPRLAFHRQTSAEMVDDLPADRESQAGARGLLGERVAHLPELLEDDPEVLAADAHAVVLHVDADVSAALR